MVCSLNVIISQLSPFLPSWRIPPHILPEHRNAGGGVVDDGSADVPEALLAAEAVVGQGVFAG
jgi:hypothetical protein